MHRTANRFREFIRCTRHNLLHLHTFRLSYKNGFWHSHDGDVRMMFPWYPFLAFHDIEGYLNQARWRPQPGATVVDAGGCYGEFSLYASKCVGPAGRVLMLEPDPANIARARELFELNGNPTNIEIVPAGLWRTPGKLRFSAGQDAQSSVLTTGQAPLDGQQHLIEIDAHSLASLVKTFDLKRLDFVKMDIEGAEIEVMSAASDLPKSHRPRYAIASYHIVDGRRTADALAEMFPKLGYYCRSGYPNHLTTWGSPTPFE